MKEGWHDGRIIVVHVKQKGVELFGGQLIIIVGFVMWEQSSRASFQCVRHPVGVQGAPNIFQILQNVEVLSGLFIVFESESESVETAVISLRWLGQRYGRKSVKILWENRSAISG